MRQSSPFSFSRREFLHSSLMATALAAVAPPLVAEPCAKPGATKYFGELRAMTPGSVLPDGWLKAWLEKQAAGLGSHLDTISWPFTEDYWGEEREGAYFTPEQEYEVWWPWEQKAYWIDGMARLGILLGNEQVLEKATRPISITMAHPDREGYLGPEVFEDPLADYHRWPHAVFFRAVAAITDAGVKVPGLNREQIADAMRRHYLSDTASYGKPKRNVNNIESMLWCYGATGDRRLLELAENAWREYQKLADDPENADLGQMRVEGDTPINAHGETYAETSKQPTLLYLHTGKPEYLRFALASQRRIFDHHILVDGAPSTSEWFATTTALDSHETCDIADHTWSWGYMLEATGDGIWGDRIERACLNAAPGAIKKDWRALQYFSAPNQVVATLDSDHNWPKFKEHGGGMMAFQPNPGDRTACCGGNVHRIFPNYAMHMWMQGAEGELAAVLYGPSRVRTIAGAEKTPVEIVEQTNYPFEEEIHFHIHCERSVELAVRLRIPAWCTAPELRLNGAPITLPKLERGFIALRRNFHSDDVLALQLPMQPALTNWPQGGVAVERGPLVFALPVEAQWTSKLTERYSTAEFPAWEARPKSAWNYGLELDRERLNSQVSMVKNDLTPEQALDPWLHPPVQLALSARRIEDWNLQTNPEKPAQQFTPPLPEAGCLAQTAETIHLIPYGCTHLRVAIFPDLKKERRTSEIDDHGCKSSFFCSVAL